MPQLSADEREDENVHHESDSAISSVLISPIGLEGQNAHLPFELEEMIPAPDLQERDHSNRQGQDTQRDMVVEKT